MAASAFVLLGCSAQQFSATSLIAASPIEATGPFIGMTVDEFQQTFGLDLQRQDEPNANNPGCAEWSAGSLALLSRDDRIVRLTTRDRALPTKEGIRVGDSGARVRAAYPAAERRSAEYVPEPGHELFVWSDADNYVGLRFEIGENGRVTAIHAGTDLRNDEGCAGA